MNGTMISTPPSSPALVACNIYISAASSRPSHPTTLLNLLRRAQDHCRRIRHGHCDGSGIAVNHHHYRNTKNPTKAASKEEITKTPLRTPVAIVHAYADIPYDRSSIHLAGYSECVAEVASELIHNALTELEFDSFGGSDTSASKQEVAAKEATIRGSGASTRHPTVGLIDHVSIMPLVMPRSSSHAPSYAPFGVSSTQSTSPADGDQAKEESVNAAAKAALQVGSNLSQYANSNSLEVFYYGRACPKNTPLAAVRRDRTTFFNSGGTRKRGNDACTIKYGDEVNRTNDDNIDRILPKFGSITIGTPQNFVENYNIRLTSKCTRSMARALTDMVRGRNVGGIVGVEALTLPYYHSEDICFEVACNLTNPILGSKDMILERVGDWVDVMRKQIVEKRDDGDVDAEKIDFDYFVQDAYRVGTTEVQCIDALQIDWYTSGQDYDNEVLTKFKNILCKR